MNEGILGTTYSRIVRFTGSFVVELRISVPKFDQVISVMIHNL